MSVLDFTLPVPQCITWFYATDVHIVQGGPTMTHMPLTSQQSLQV